MAGTASTVTTALSPPRAGGTQAAIAHAAERTGVDFSYLLAQAHIESGMNPRAEASTSSASGLYQFIDQTWLATLDKHGEQLGYADMARAIETRGGRARIADPAMRDAIMALRFDPQAASLMAGALATDNRAALTPVLGREPDASELYLAHFLGEEGATRFLSTLSSNPDASAAAILPRAAGANRAIFYKPGGAARSVQAVMGIIRGRVEGAMANAGAAPLPVLPPSAVPPAWRQPSMPTATRYAPALSATPLAGPPVMHSMASTLHNSFGLGSKTDPSAPGIAHIRSAYSKLEAFGL